MPNETQETNPKLEFGGSGATGVGSAFYQPISTNRRVKHYCISEDEIEGLGDLGNNVTLWAAILTASCTELVSILWETSNSQEPMAKTARGLTFLFTAVAIASFIVTVLFWRRKNSRLKNIQKQTTEE